MPWSECASERFLGPFGASRVLPVPFGAEGNEMTGEDRR